MSNSERPRLADDYADIKRRMEELRPKPEGVAAADDIGLPADHPGSLTYQEAHQVAVALGCKWVDRNSFTAGPNPRCGKNGTKRCLLNRRCMSTNRDEP